MTVNAWLTTDAMEHCITICDCRVVLLDAERAKQLQGSVAKLEKAGAVGILVYRSATPPNGMWSFDGVLGSFER